MRAQDGVVHHADPQRLGDWKILARLGAGGMGVVYLGERGDERAAIKTIRDDLALDESFKKRFAREANAMATTDSPRVAQVLEADIDSSPPYIAFKFYDGPNLRDVIKAGGPLDPTALRALAVGLAEGLQAIHTQDVVHRDIKPSNIIMTVRGPVIIDFGIAAYHSSEMTQLTVTGEPIGSPTWMSPEYITTGYASEPGDVFGWASTLQFAATGMPPFGVGAPQPLLYRITNVEPTPHRIAGPLGMLISQSLAKNPANRPMVAELLHTLDVTGGDAFSAAVGTVVAAPEVPAAAALAAAPRPAIGAPPARRPPAVPPPPQFQPAPQYQPAYPLRPAAATLPYRLGRSVGRSPAIWAVSLIGLLGLFAAFFALASSASAPEITDASTSMVPPTPMPVELQYQLSTGPIPIVVEPPGLEMVVNAPSGPARVINRSGLVVYRDPVPESPVLGELAAGQRVIADPVAMLVDDATYIKITSERNRDLRGFVELTGLAFEEPGS